VKQTDPLDYKEFVHALQEATLVLSDSGRVQEEAPALCKPVLVLREETERHLVVTARARIQEEAFALLTDPRRYQETSNTGGSYNTFGNDHASARILRIMGLAPTCHE